jgi:formate transporter
MLAIVAGGGIGFGVVYYTIVASDPTLSIIHNLVPVRAR